MSGVDVSFEGSAGPRSENEVMSLSTTADKLQNAEPSILASLNDRHRLRKARISFDKLSMIERKKFYKEAVDYVSSCPTGNLTASEAARRVAMMYTINIPDCDRAKIRVIVCSRLGALKRWTSLLRTLSLRHLLILLPLTIGMRRGVRSVDALAPMVLRPAMRAGLPSSKMQRPFKGASSHLNYQEILKFEATAAASRFQVAKHHAPVGETPSFNGAVKGMRTTLAARDVDICQSTC